MASPLATLPAGTMAGGPAASVLTTNVRVKSQMGALGIATDVLQFAGPMISGAWTVPNTRVFVGSIPTVSTMSTGLAVGPLGAGAPVSVSMGDARVSGS